MNDGPGRRCTVATIVICIASAISACAPCEYVTTVELAAELTGSEVVPPTTSSLDGSIRRLTASVTEGRFAGQRISMELTTSLSPEDVTAVHLHAGLRGEHGSVIMQPPFNPRSMGDGFEVHAGWEYGGGIPIEELLQRLRQEAVYVDIHTTRFPGGELRGQLELVSFQERTAFYCSISG